MTSPALPLPSTGPSEPVGPRAVLAQMKAATDELNETLWAAQPGSDLMGTVEDIAVLRAKLDAIELAVTGELEVNPPAVEAVKNAGWASVKDYLTHISGGRRGAGPAALRLARQVSHHGPLLEALASGTTSRVKVQIIAAAVEKLPNNTELREQAVRVLLDDARRLSAEDLERAGRHVLEVVDPDGVDAALERELERAERSAHLNRTLMMRFDRLGGGDGQFSGSAEDLLLLKTTLLSLAAPEPADPGSCGGDDGCTDLVCKRAGHPGRDLRDHGARMFDALIHLARHAQATGALPDCHGGVPQVTITMDLEDLKNQLGEATTTLGVEVDATTVRRLACDADIIPGVLGADGSVLDVGRAQRLVTAAIWVALVVRDQHCAFPGCRRPPVMCHAHHIRHWADGGETSLDNLVLVCGTHHRILHNTPWEVRLSPRDRRPEFRPPDKDVWIRDRDGSGRPPDPEPDPSPPDSAPPDDWDPPPLA